MVGYARLGNSVVPAHYTLLHEPNFDSCIFKGTVDIDLCVHESVNELVLNGHNFTDVHVSSLKRLAASAPLSAPTGQVKRKLEIDNEHSLNIKRKRPLACPGRFKQTSTPIEDEPEIPLSSSIKKIEHTKSKESVDNESVDSDEGSNTGHGSGHGEEENEQGEDEGDEEVEEDEEDEEDKEDEEDEENEEDEEDSDNESDDSGHEEKSDKNEEESDGASDRIQIEADQNSLDQAGEGTSPSEKHEKTNDNVIIENKGMMLMRSEWTEPDQTSDEDDNTQSDGDEHNETISSDGQDDVENVIVSSDEDDVCDIRDDDSDDGDVMQVDGLDDGAVVDTLTDKEKVESENCSEETENEPTEDKTEQISDNEEKKDCASEVVDAEKTDTDDVEVEVEGTNLLEAQVIVVKLKCPLLPGNYTLSLVFAGPLDDSMRGFYRTKHNVLGQDKWGAACHFEATGARKCFPCFDQPEFRSTFDISVRRPNPQMEVLSNMPSTGEDDGVVRFARTPALPTYLVCVVLGYYDSISRRTENGVRISLYTQISQTIQVEFALDVATGALNFYQEFFGVDYPLPKMDLVAVPDFYIGAMENWGLLTFRETALMYHPVASTISRKQYVAILVCHEIAHQWFGNLVSIEWWSQLWLKEGFATWISFLAVDHLFPEFDIWSDFQREERLQALNLDSLESSHPIQVEVKDPGQIDEIFDAISYSKGASIINMLYHWIGEEKFKQGLNRYLCSHKNSSAETSDLWHALDSVMGLGTVDHVTNTVEQVMDAWTTLQGFPKVKVDLSEDGVVCIKQEILDDRRWKIPLTIYIDGSKEINLLEDSVSFNCEKGFPVVNQGQTSFCRVQYDWALIQLLKDHIHTLDVRDRAGVLSDLFCFSILDGQEKVGRLLEVLEWYAGETDWLVVYTVLDVLGRLAALVEDTKAWAGFLQFAYKILQPSLTSLGWRRRPGDINENIARSAIIERLGRLGNSETAGEAMLLWRREQRGKEPIPMDIRAVVYRTAARHGTRSDVDLFIQKFHEADRSEEKQLVLSALASFSDYNLIQEILAWSMTDAVKLQDRVGLIVGVARSGPEGKLAAWNFFKANFGVLRKQYTSGNKLIMLIKGVTAHLNTMDLYNAAKDFFAENDVPAAARTIKQCLEDIRVLAQKRIDLRDSLFEYLQSHSKPLQQNSISRVKL